MYGMLCTFSFLFHHTVVLVVLPFTCHSRFWISGLSTVGIFNCQDSERLQAFGIPFWMRLSELSTMAFFLLFKNVLFYPWQCHHPLHLRETMAQARLTYVGIWYGYQWSLHNLTVQHLVRYLLKLIMSARMLLKELLCKIIIELWHISMHVGT